MSVYSWIRIRPLADFGNLSRMARGISAPLITDKVRSDQQTKVVPPAGEPEEHPLPSDPKAIFLGGLFVLALLTTAFVAREIVLPLVFAIVLKLLLQPALRVLERLHIPRCPRRCC
jgi:hypothetical protein